jgi:hypothetical protein
MVEHAEEIIRGLLAALASVQARNPDNGSADEDRLNNAADLIRYLLGYDDEPDESTAGMIYDAIEGDDHAFRQVVSLARSPDNLTEALQEIVEMTEGHPGIARLHHIAKDALATGLPAGETTT